jgi:hypothetical protein
MATTLDDVAEAVSAAVLEALPHRGSGDELLIEFVEELGWTLPLVPPVLRELDGEVLGGAMARLTHARRRDDMAEVVPAAIAVTTALGGLATALDELPQRLRAELPAAFVTATQIDALFRARLLDHCVCRYLERRYRHVVEIARVLGLVVVEERPPRPDVFQPAYTHRELHLARVTRLVSDPRSVFAETLQWGNSTLVLDTMLAALLQLSIERDMPARYAYPPKALAGVPPPGPGLLLPLLDQPPFRVSAGVFPGRSDAGKAGLLLMLGSEGLLDRTLPLSADLSVEIATTLAAPFVALRLHPDRAPQLDAVPFDGGGVPVSGALTTTLRLGSTTEPRSLLELGPFELAGRSVYVRAGLSRQQDISDAFIEAGLEGGKLAVTFADDGLLGSLIELEKIEVDLDLGLGWSLQRGTYMAGHVGLEVTIPTERRIGPASLTALRIGLRVVNDALVLSGAMNGSLALGPVELTFGGLGVDLVASAGGKLGIADIDVSPRGPDRIGLRIDAPLVSGEGEITHDAAARRYAGSFAIQVGPVAVRAVAALDAASPTLPRPSLTVLATSQFPRMPLGEGFTLDGVGMVLGTDRRIDVDAIRAGLRTGQVAALLGDSGDALAVLPRLFPQAPGRVVVGVYAKIGWGTPQIVDARLLPVFELAAPTKIVVLGTLELGLPTLEHRIVDLRMDAVGTVDLERAALAIDASLHDSSLAGIPLTGDMALRLSLAGIPSLLLSIGGFHPRFTPPARFPELRRIELTAGTNPQLRMSAYLALSYVSTQIGAHVDLVAKGGGFKIQAHLGFDALFSIFPFRFDVEIDATASISWHGHNLLGVHLDLHLSGPHPYHAKGSASFSVLWWDVSVGFDQTWGDKTPVPLPPPPDLAALLREALGRPDAWNAELPTRSRPLFALADGVSRETVPPTASVVVRQRTLPLAYNITMFGNVPLSSEQRFSIDHVRHAAGELEASPVDAPFAVGQFTQLSDDEKLAAPTFEQYTAGVRIADGTVRAGTISRSPIDLDTIVRDELAPPDTEPEPSILEAVLATSFVSLRAAREPVAAEPPPRLHDLKFVVASVADLTTASPSATFSASREALRAQPPLLGHFQIVPLPHSQPS